eukprot:1090894-Amphidinium_carterae.1
MACARGQYGPNKDTRALVIFRLILAFYRTANVRNDRLKRLPYKRFKPDKARPRLKVSAGQLRALVPFFRDLTASWHASSQEVKRVQEATRLMAQCYDFLSTGPTALPMADFNATAISLAEVLVVLQ